MARLAGLNTQFTMERLRVSALRHLVGSRLGIRLARAMLAPAPPKPYHRVAAEFYLNLLEMAYADRKAPVVWTNIFVPSELFWGLGVVPFYPETIAGLGASLDLSPVGVKRAEELGYPIDLCTVHRCAAGLRDVDLFPAADAYVSTSNTCDLAGQMLAGFAHSDGKPFFFLDVPQGEDVAAVDYLAVQLRNLVDFWVDRLGVTYDPERLRQALRWSNQAREMALQVAKLRRANPAPLRGSSMSDQLAMLTSIVGHPSGVDYYRTMRDYTRERVETTDPEQHDQRVRIYWMYLMPYFPNNLMSHLEEDLGVAIAFEEISQVWWGELDERDPLRSLAGKMLAMFFNGLVERRIEVALRHVESYSCAGAIHFGHWGCRQSSGSLDAVRTRLRRAGVPLLLLDGDSVDPSNLQMGPLLTRIEAFIEMLT